MFEDKLKTIQRKIAKTVATNHKSVVGIHQAMNQFWNAITRSLAEARMLLSTELVALGLKPDNIIQVMESPNRLIQVIMVGDIYLSFIFHKVGSVFDGKNFKLCGRIIIYFGNILKNTAETSDIEDLMETILQSEMGSFFIFNEKLVVYRDDNAKRTEFDDFEKAINSTLWGHIRDKQFPPHPDKSGGQVVFV